MCEALDEERCYVAGDPEGAIEFGLCPNIGAWRLRTPVSDLIGRVDGDKALGLPDALQQAISDADRGEHYGLARQLRELATGFEEGYLP